METLHIHIQKASLVLTLILCAPLPSSAIGLCQKLLSGKTTGISPKEAQQKLKSVDAILKIYTDIKKRGDTKPEKQTAPTKDTSSFLAEAKDLRELLLPPLNLSLSTKILDSNIRQFIQTFHPQIKTHLNLSEAEGDFVIYAQLVQEIVFLNPSPSLVNYENFFTVLDARSTMSPKLLVIVGNLVNHRDSQGRNLTQMMVDQRDLWNEPLAKMLESFASNHPIPHNIQRPAPLSVAVKLNKPTRVEQILAHGGQASSQLLYSAVQLQNFDIAKILLKYGTPVEFTVDNPYIAARLLESAKELTEDIDATLKPEQKTGLLKLAQKAGLNRWVEYLKKNGATN